MKTAKDAAIRNALSELGRKRHSVNIADGPAVHPFPARMPIPLAEYLLQALLAKRGHVLDPMTGSGSTLVAARRLGHTGHGVDIDPLAVLMSRSATTSYERRVLERLGRRILERAEDIYSDLSRTSVATMLEGTEEEREFFEYWFPQKSQRQLYCLRQAIYKESKTELRNMAWAAFSSLIIAKATSVSYAIDIPRSRPHKDDNRDIDAPFEVWEQRFGQVVNRLPFLDRKPKGVAPLIRRGDARHLPQGDNSLDLVLTSPPYLNAVDYLRGHKFSLVWMGHALSALRERRGRMIGSERGMWKPNGLPPSVEQSLTECIEEERSRAITRRYLSDLRYSMLEMKRVVRPDGLIAVVLGPSIMDPDESDSIDIARVIARSANLQFVAGVLRPLKGTRRSLPPPETVSQKSELALRMSFEAIVVFRKKNDN
jgi:DNA modification methylase